MERCSIQGEQFSSDTFELRKFWKFLLWNIYPDLLVKHSYLIRTNKHTNNNNKTKKPKWFPNRNFSLELNHPLVLDFRNMGILDFPEVFLPPQRILHWKCGPYLVTLLWEVLETLGTGLRELTVGLWGHVFTLNLVLSTFVSWPAWGEWLCQMYPSPWHLSHHVTDIMEPTILDGNLWNREIK